MRELRQLVERLPSEKLRLQVINYVRELRIATP
jgi:hypothetical protein